MRWRWYWLSGLACCGDRVFLRSRISLPNTAETHFGRLSYFFALDSFLPVPLRCGLVSSPSVSRGPLSFCSFITHTGSMESARPALVERSLGLRLIARTFWHTLWASHSER